MLSPRRLASIALPLLAVGCSLIARSEPDQCATDNDCYVKFGGALVCQAGACVTASAQAVERTTRTLDQCRSTQECVAFRGEGWLCRRDRDDPQKQGTCQQLTPTSECTILGDYKHDGVVMLGALLPGSNSPALAARIRDGLSQAVTEWEQETRRLAAVPTGPEYVAPPRPFAVLACSEDMAQLDLQNQFLNNGVVAVVGPSSLRAGTTDPLATALTNAQLLLVAPTTFDKPKEGSNVGLFYFRVSGAESSLGAAIATEVGVDPRQIIRRTGSFDSLTGQLKTTGVGELTYDQPDTFTGVIDKTTIVLGDGEAAQVLMKAQRNANIPASTDVFVLPTAIPDVMAAKVAGELNFPIRSFRSASRSTTIPATPFGRGTYGDAEAFDALYTLLTAIAALPPTMSVEEIKETTIQLAYARVTDLNSPTTIDAVPTSIRQLLNDLRADPEARLSLTGASGPLKMTEQRTTRSWQPCTVTQNGCQ